MRHEIANATIAFSVLSMLVIEFLYTVVHLILVIIKTVIASIYNNIVDINKVP